MIENFEWKKFFMWIASLTVVVLVNVGLFMLIWNNVLIPKFPSANIQQVTFPEALAISVFVGLLTGHQSVVHLVSLK